MMKQDLEKKKKKRNFKYIKEHIFDMEEHDGYTIDDQTWNDFNMDEIFKKVR